MKRVLFSILFIFAIAAISFGQAKVGAFGEIIIEQAAPIPEILTINKQNIRNGALNKAEAEKGGEAFKDLKEESYRYMSYRILVTTVEEPLDLSHFIFQNFNEVSFNQTKDAGFAYYAGDYSNEDQANDALSIVKKKYPEASLVKERKYLKKN